MLMKQKLPTELKSKMLFLPTFEQWLFNAHGFHNIEELFQIYSPLHAKWLADKYRKEYNLRFGGNLK